MRPMTRTATRPSAGAFRLLLPPQAEALLADMRTAREAVVSRGPWGSKPEAIEVMFEDGSNNPVALHIGAEQIDRMPLDSDAGRELTLAVWTKGPHKALTLPAWYRRVPKLPWLQPRS